MDRLSNYVLRHVHICISRYKWKLLTTWTGYAALARSVMITANKWVSLYAIQVESHFSSSDEPLVLQTILVCTVKPLLNFESFSRSLKLFFFLCLKHLNSLHRIQYRLQAKLILLLKFFDIKPYMIGLRQDCIYGRQLKTTCKNKISIVCSKIKYESKIIILTLTRLSKIRLLHHDELVGCNMHSQI